MAGTFNKLNRPKRPGAYFNFVAARPIPVVVGTSGIVAIPFVHDWGPSESIVEINSFGEFVSVFGPGATLTPGYKAVAQAFQGEGLPSKGGAAAVLAYRMTGSAAAKASASRTNGTAPAITLTAIYEGTYGGNLTFAVLPDATNPSTVDNLVIYLNGSEVERFIYAKTNITDLAAQVNGTTPYTAATKSDWVVASAVTSGTALTTTGGSPIALTGGNDGSTLAAGDYTAWMSAIEPSRFAVAAPSNLTDGSILASMVTWVKNLNAAGKRFMAVVGGLAAETASTAVTRTGTINDPNFVNLGIGTYTDEVLGDLSTAELAPRLAGIIARRGERENLTFARLAGLSIKVGATTADILAAIAGGVTTFAQDSHLQAPVRVDKGLTAYTSDTADRPNSIYSVPKFVLTMQGIERDLTEFAEQNVIGSMPVNDGTRQYLRGQMESRMAAREAAGVIQHGFVVELDPDPAPSPTDDFVALRYQFTFARSLELVLNTVTIG